MMWMLAFSFLTAMAMMLMANARAESIGFSVAQGGRDILVEVFHDVSLQPISGASVTIADSLFAWKWTVTGRTGKTGSVLARKLGSDTKAVTVSKNGYTQASVIGVRNGTLRVFLKPILAQRPLIDDVIARGTLTGWRLSPRSDVIYAGLVFRAVSALDLFNIGARSFVSPLSDEIDVFGPRKIPSNLVLPEQDVFFVFGAITLNKPDYRLPLEANREIRLTGIQGDVPVDDVAQVILQGRKVGLNILNKIKFSRFGLSGPVTPTADLTKDVEASVELAPKHEVTVNAPPFSSDVLTISVTDLTGDRGILIPTDIKLAVAQGQTPGTKPTTLRAPKNRIGSSFDVITVATADNAKRLSGIVTAQAGKSVRPGDYLAVEQPESGGALPEFVSLSPTRDGFGTVVFKNKYPLWYVHVLPSAGTVMIPTSAIPEKEAARSYSKAHFEFAGFFDERSVDGRTIMRKLTRFAQSTSIVAAGITAGLERQASR